MGLMQEVKDNEFNDLLAKGWLVQGVAGSYHLSAKGLDQYNRLFEMLAAKYQVLISLKLASNADTTIANIKNFMQ